MIILPPRALISLAKLVFKIKIFFMSNNKRPRPAIPVLVHVDNQTEVDNTIVTKNVKSINETLGSPNDYSTNTSVVGLLKGIKENITGGGGGSGGGVDMTTVNTNTTQINNVLGDVSEESTSGTINGRLQRNNELTERTATNVLNMHDAVGSKTDNVGSSTIVGQLKQTNKTLGTVRSTTASDDLFGKISAIRNYTENNNDKLVNIKNTLGEPGDVVSASTISGRLYSVADVTGTRTDSAADATISGKLQAIKIDTSKNYTNVGYIKSSVGTTSDASDANTVIGLLKGIKESGGSGAGADMTTVNTNTTAIKDTIGTSGDPQDTNTISGKLSALRGTNHTIALYSETIRNNLGVASDSSSSGTVIGLLKRIIENN